MTTHQALSTTSRGGPLKLPHYTVTGLKRWSCQSKDLPSPSRIRSLHVYDFDNTLFRSPLPNPKLWNPYTISRLQNQDVFANGGWWHDEQVLGATGQGLDMEEPRAWSGWWNEQIAELVRLSFQQHDALSVLLTGRGERGFSDLIRRMIASKRLDFDLICLKPEVGPKNQRFSSTMHFKQAFLQDLLYTYHEAEQIKIYEDRPKQTKGFRDFLQNLNSITFPDTGRRPLRADVLQVADQVTTLDPVIEVAQVQSMINKHNAQLNIAARPLEIRQHVFYTAYLINPADTAKLLDLVKIPAHLAESEIKFLANNIMIAPGSANTNTMGRIGGLGAKQTWQVNAFSFYQSSIWAVRVTPVPPTSQPHTFTQTPLIVLATYKNAKPEVARSIKNWQTVPVEKQYILQTEVGEKVQLRLEFAPNDHEAQSRSEWRGSKRRHSPPYGNPSNDFSSNLVPNQDTDLDFDGIRKSRQQANILGKGTAITRGRHAPGSGFHGSKGAQGRSGRSRKPLAKSYVSLDDPSNLPASTLRYAPRGSEAAYEMYLPSESGTASKHILGGLPYGQ